MRPGEHRAALVLREATADDAVDIARLLTQLGHPTASTDVPARLVRMAERDRVMVLVAARGRQVVGLATVHLHVALHRSRDVAWLTTLVVDESERGRGIGRRLVEAVEAYARQQGCERLSVTTHEHLTGARAFYERVGLPPTGRRFGKMLLP